MPESEPRQHYIKLVTRELERLRSEVRKPGRQLKDAAAVQALKLASRLFDFQAGWARDHLIGRELKGIRSVPYAQGTQREQALGRERPWDNPGLERFGREYNCSNDDLNQRILIELIFRCAPVFGERLAKRLSDAFAELQAGGTHGLVTSPRHGDKKRRELFELQIRGVEHANFRHGSGLSKQRALMRVAAAYGIGSPPETDAWKTIERWESRLRARFGEYRTRDMVSRAYNHGEWFKHLSTSRPLEPHDEEFMRDIEQEFGAGALRADGRRYRQLVPASRRRPKRK